MAETTKIEWAEATWNPWHGCVKVSPGCKFCYMYRDKERFGQDPTEVVKSKSKFDAPLRWRAPSTIFTCSWSDFFVEEADAWRPEAWEIIRLTPQHTYQILTKRPERVRAHIPEGWMSGDYDHVQLGVSVENQDYMSRALQLAFIPAATRFVSAEPLLGPLEFNPYVLQCLDWMIVGGESGPSARPMAVSWVRGVKSQCDKSEVAFFMKQGSQANWPKFKDFKSFPEDLQVREMPCPKVLSA